MERNGEEWKGEHLDCIASCADRTRSRQRKNQGRGTPALGATRARPFDRGASVTPKNAVLNSCSYEYVVATGVGITEGETCGI